MTLCHFRPVVERLIKQSRRRKTEFLPTILRLKIDLALYLAHSEVLADRFRYKLWIVFCWKNIAIWRCILRKINLSITIKCLNRVSHLIWSFAHRKHQFCVSVNNENWILIRDIDQPFVSLEISFSVLLFNILNLFNTKGLDKYVVY